jgi:phage recombination protein Bet
MSNLAAIQPQHVAAFSPDQTALIKRTVAPDASNDELAMFLHVAAKSGLDPLQRQIWFVKRKANVGTKENPRWEDRVTIQAGIDGLQARAARESDYEGMLYGVVCAKDDFRFNATTGVVEAHTYNPFADRGQIMGAWCIVRRKALLPFTAMVRFSEYYDDRSFLWKGKPAVMIEKVARSTALRRAYPEQFGGIYESAEMGDKAAEPPALEVEAQPIPSRAAEAKRLEAAPAEPAAAVVEHAAEGEPSAEQYYARIWSRVKAKFGKNAAAKMAWAIGKAGIPRDLSTDAWTLDQAGQVDLLIFPPEPDDRPANDDIPF